MTQPEGGERGTAKVDAALGGWTDLTVSQSRLVPAGVFEEVRNTARQLERELTALRKEAAGLKRIAWLIGSIYVHGNFKAETMNERELESLLRANGTFWESLADFDAALARTERGE